VIIDKNFVNYNILSIAKLKAKELVTVTKPHGTYFSAIAFRRRESKSIWLGETWLGYLRLGSKRRIICWVCRQRMEGKADQSFKTYSV